MTTTPAALLAVVGVVACAAPPGGRPVCQGSVPITLVQYNVAGVGSGQAGQDLAEQLAGIGPDFIAAQECGECEALVEKLPPSYRISGAVRAGVAILYDSDRWQRLDSGTFELGDNDDGWGARVTQWSHFAHIESSQCLDIYATHWCVPIRSETDTCTTDRQLQYAEATLERIEDRVDPESPLLFAGDLNVFDGFEDGPVISELVSWGLIDLFRELDPDGDGTTFVGNDWAPPGRIDYVFATPPVAVLAATIDRPAEPTSDHHAVVTTTQFPATGGR